MSADPRIAADREVCIGAGMCVLTAPEIFDQDDDGLVRLLVDETGRLAGPDVESARQAARLCPSGALTLRGAAPPV